jgi:hypothetical protein
LNLAAVSTVGSSTCHKILQGSCFIERIATVRLTSPQLLPADVMNLHQGQEGEEDLLLPKDLLNAFGAGLVLDQREDRRGIQQVGLTNLAY